MIKAIIFDLGEVILVGMKGVQNHLASFLDMLPEDIYYSLKGDIFLSLMNGEITEEEYWSKIIEKNKWDIGIKELKDAIRKNFQEIPGTIEILKALKLKYKLGLLSVHGKEWIQFCNKKFDHHKFFDAIYYSFEEGVGKPDKRAYEKILIKLDVSAGQAIFIDDQERFLLPARELGIKTVLFKNSKQLKEELSLLGVEI